MGDFERMPRDVLTMLRVELRQAKAGTWTLHPNSAGVDVDLVEMFEETIAEIERLRSWANALADALVVADDAGGYPTDVLKSRVWLLEAYPAIQAQLIAEINRRERATDDE